jgi:MFS family permease
MSLSLNSRGTKVFLQIWIGQLISSIGSGMTSFAVNVWVYQQTKSTQSLALMVLAATLPGILISPLAGAAADRWDRRWVMVFSNIGAALSTFSIAAAFFFSATRLWEIYLGLGGISFFAAFQSPACLSASSTLLSKEHYARASGLWQFAQAITMIAAPPAAVLLIPAIGIQGVILGDFASYMVAIAILLTVQIPRHATLAPKSGRASLFHEVAAGWVCIRERRPLGQLLAFSAIVLFAINMMQVLLVPLVLSVASAGALALVIATATIGMVVGSVVMAGWGGPRRRMRGVLISAAAVGAALFLTGLQRQTLWMAASLFVLGCIAPLGVGCAQSIWQTKVDLALQGRVFALRGMINQACLPVACLAAGPLVDKVFNPLLAGGGLPQQLATAAGLGPGRGAGLLIALVGIVSMTCAVVGVLNGRFRRLDQELPDAVPDHLPGNENETEGLVAEPIAELAETKY